MPPRYRPLPGGWWFPLLVFGFMIVFGVGALVSSLTSDSGMPLGFACIWWLVVTWNGYWFLWRLAGELWVDGSTLQPWAGRAFDDPTTLAA